MKKILVVEDEQMLANIIDIKLKEEDFEVQHAYDGAQAYEMLAGTDIPDLVLLDILLPQMTGFEVLEKLRAEKKTIPKVIVFSNFAQKEDIDRAHELGAVDYIVKAAFSPAEILAKVKSVLDGERTERVSDDPYEKFESLEDVKPMSEVIKPE